VNVTGRMRVKTLPVLNLVERCMDRHSLDLLEFPKIRDLLASQAATTLGKDAARQLAPSTDRAWIEHELGLVSEAMEALDQDMPPPLGGLSDVRLLVRRASIGSVLTASELLEVRDLLNCTGHIFRYRMKLADRWPRLQGLLQRVEDLGTVGKSLEGSLDPRGQVLDMASEGLANVRSRLRELDERMQERIKRLLRDPEFRKYLRFPNATVSGDHYVFPVAVNYRQKVPGVVHRTSATGDTVFIEPAALAALSAELAVLKAEEQREVTKVLRKLTAEVGRVSRQLQTAIEVLSQVDLVMAKAKFSRAYDLVPPHVNPEGRVWLQQARHPLLLHLCRHGLAPQPLPPEATAAPVPRDVVPIDVRLGMEFDLMVITGPNTGGKTVALKTVGLCALMAQAGIPIPAAKGSTLPIFEHVLVDIGDEQSLEQSLSTFSSHMARVAEILTQANPRSLVLLDELGAGTDPTEGAALGRAILDKLRDLGCRAMVTTHIGDLKTYAFGNDRAENAAVEFDVESLRPTYRLLIGQIGASNALQIARRLRLPRDLLRRARFYLRRRERRKPEILKLQQAREQAELARRQALLAEQEAQREREVLAQQRLEFERQSAAEAKLRAARQQLQAGDLVRVARFDEPGRVVRLDRDKGMAIVKAGLGQWAIPLAEVFPVKAGEG
jgi:DNA mismatch repair protein MutS2